MFSCWCARKGKEWIRQLDAPRRVHPLNEGLDDLGTSGRTCIHHAGVRNQCVRYSVQCYNRVASARSCPQGIMQKISRAAEVGV